jgi:hypothetical protein
MNHLKAIFKNVSGKKLAYETWETHFEGYRRIGLLLNEPFIPVDKSMKLIELLLKKYYKVYNLKIPELGQSNKTRGGLKTFCANIGGFRSYISRIEKSIPIVAFVSSLAVLPFLNYYFDAAPPIKLVLLISPVFNFSKYPFDTSLCFKRKIKIELESFTCLESESADIKESLENDYFISAKLVRNIRKANKTYPKSFQAQLLDTSIGVFTGDNDKFLDLDKINALKDALEKGSLEHYTYPRSGHLLLHDTKWKNVLNDIESFIDTNDSILASV